MKSPDDRNRRGFSRVKQCMSTFNSINSWYNQLAYKNLSSLLEHL